MSHKLWNIPSRRTNCTSKVTCIACIIVLLQNNELYKKNELTEDNLYKHQLVVFYSSRLPSLKFQYVIQSCRGLYRDPDGRGREERGGEGKGGRVANPTFQPKVCQNASFRRKESQ